MTGNTQDLRDRWLNRAAMGVVGIGMLGLAACGGSSGGGVYYTDGYHGGTGVYYQETYRPARHYHRHYDRGYYDRNGYWRRY